MTTMFRPFITATTVVTILSALAIASGTGTGATETGTSPLAAYPGFGHAEPTDQERFEREADDREHLIVACMSEAGFHYSPGMADYDATMASLSDSERDAWSEAFRGHDGDNLYREGQGGCLGYAHRTTPGVFLRKAILSEEHTALLRGVRDTAQVQAALNDWRTCAANAGIDAEDPWSFQRDVEAARLDRSDDSAADHSDREQVAHSQTCAEATLTQAARDGRLRLEREFVETHGRVLNASDEEAVAMLADKLDAKMAAGGS